MGQADVLNFLAENPGWYTQKEIGEVLGSYSNAQKLLCKLERDGEVITRRYSRGKSNGKEYAAGGRHESKIGGDKKYNHRRGGKRHRH